MHWNTESTTNIEVRNAVSKRLVLEYKKQNGQYQETLVHMYDG